MASNLGIIISREFSERVAKKSFIITTLLMPVVMMLMMLAPALVMLFSTPSEKRLAVVDESGIMLPALIADRENLESLTLCSTSAPLDSIIADPSYDGVLFIGADIVDNPANATLYLHDAGSMKTEGAIAATLERTIESERLKHYNIENLPKILEEVKADVYLSTVRVDESGDNTETSSSVSYILGLAMTFILYMFLLMYGQMVMTSIIEEKNNRVLELMVSSVKPITLMMGKIIGVGLVAVTQVAIWCVLLCAVSAFVMPLMMPAEMSSQMSMMQAGTLDLSTVDSPEMLQAMGMFASPAYIATLFGYILLFLVGGFLFYASIFAAIGSAVDNIQDASQLQTFAVVPIMLGIVLSMTIVEDPNSSIALWCSMIPFTSPMLMLSRIPFGIPTWQIIVSVVILYLSFVGMAWIAAKIYRVGIFMYGKKPTFRDLLRWARYK